MTLGTAPEWLFEGFSRAIAVGSVRGGEGRCAYPGDQEGGAEVGVLGEFVYLGPGDVGLLWSERLGAILRRLLYPRHDPLTGLAIEEREGDIAQ